jgi:hypothetical protein
MRGAFAFPDIGETMGVLHFSAGKYARSRGAGSATTLSTKVRTSGAFTTSSAADNVEDGSGEITMAVGEVFQGHSATAHWLTFGGGTATAGSDIYLPAGAQREYEVEVAGTVSAIEA